MAEKMAENMIVTMPIRLEYDYSPGAGRSRFLRGLERGKILGERCAVCHKVYVGGGSGACPRDGVPTEEVVELPDEVADFVVRATLHLRAAKQEWAENTPGTPERERKNDR